MTKYDSRVADIVNKYLPSLERDIVAKADAELADLCKSNKALVTQVDEVRARMAARVAKIREIFTTNAN